jgi:hypothetical protein
VTFVNKLLSGVGLASVALREVSWRSHSRSNRTPTVPPEWTKQRQILRAG